MYSLTAILHATDRSADSLRLEEREIPTPGPDEVLVRLGYSPVNPADLNVLSGTYGERLELPGVPGNEGAGVVRALGSAVTSCEEGDVVIAPRCAGFWQQYRCFPAAELVVVPPGISERDAAILSVNPATAWLMLREFVPLKAGDWIVQNAANSAVGQWVAQFAKARGLHTANVVRSQAAVDLLLELGADCCVLDVTNFANQLRQAITGPCPLALNGVGGENARQLTRALQTRGTLVTYGAMSRENLSVGGGQLIFKDLRFVGFWVSAWLRQASAVALQSLFADIAHTILAENLRFPQSKLFPLTALADAISASEAGGTKVLLEL